MPWSSSGSMPSSTQGWANQISQMGEQLQEYYDKRSDKAKAADYFMKANPEALSRMGMSQEDFDALGHNDKSAVFDAATQLQGYQKGQQDMARTMAQMKEYNALAEQHQIETGRLKALPEFAKAFSDAGQPSNEELSDRYENPEKYPGMTDANEPQAADINRMWQAGIKAAPAAMDDKMLGEYLKYNYETRGNKTYAPSEMEKRVKFMHDYFGTSTEESKKLEEANLLGPSMRIVHHPDGTMEVVQGKQLTPNEPTAGVRTKLQEEAVNNSSIVDLLGSMGDNMKSEDFGLKGIGRDLKVKLGPMLGMDVSDEDLSVRKTIPLLRSSLYKVLRSDSNISEAEREQIQKALPSEHWLESKEDAAQSMKVISKYLQGRQRKISSVLDSPLPAWAMTYEEIVAGRKSGAITEKEAVNAIKRYHQEEAARRLQLLQQK